MCGCFGLDRPPNTQACRPGRGLASTSPAGTLALGSSPPDGERCKSALRALARGPHVVAELPAPGLCQPGESPAGWPSLQKERGRCLSWGGGACEREPDAPAPFVSLLWGMWGPKVTWP